MMKQYKIHIITKGRGFTNITKEIAAIVLQTNVTVGLCHLFLHHTSASLTLCENADPLVLRDLEAFTQRFIPDDDPLYQHIAEGPDDMASHVRSVLIPPFLILPITDKKLALGTWQGIFLWEHRLQSHERKITVTVQS